MPYIKTAFYSTKESVNTVATTVSKKITTKKKTTSEKPELVDYVDPFEVEKMIRKYIKNQGSLDKEMLAEVTSLEIWGDLVFVDCGENKGTQRGIVYCSNSYFTSGEDPQRYTIGTLKDISFVKYCKNLETLSISYNMVEDITPIKGLTSVNILFLSNNRIKDISVLKSLKNLEVLVLSCNSISDISPLGNIKSIYGISIDGNPVKDFSPLLEIDSITGYLYLPANTNKLARQKIQNAFPNTDIYYY